MPERLSKIIREPVSLFLMIGFLVFGLRSLIPDDGPGKQQEIFISEMQIEQMATEFASTWLRPPTETELQNLIENLIRDEVYYREALALGLDRNDQVIQNRLRQKLELLMDNMASVNVPTEQMLISYLESHPEDFRTEYSVSFTQVYFNPENHGDPEAEARKALEALRAGTDPRELGDMTLTGYDFQDYRKSDVARQFGPRFSDQLATARQGEWTDPLFSGLGVHLVRIDEMDEGDLPELSEIRPLVEREWRAARKQELKDAAYASLLENYRVTVAKPGQDDE